MTGHFRGPKGTENANSRKEIFLGTSNRMYLIGDRSSDACWNPLDEDVPNTPSIAMSFLQGVGLVTIRGGLKVTPQIRTVVQQRSASRASVQGGSGSDLKKKKDVRATSVGVRSGGRRESKDRRLVYRREKRLAIFLPLVGTSGLSGRQ